MNAPAWRKSSYSGGSSGQSDCVELARLSGAIGIRDSKDPEGGMLAVSAAELGRLLSAVKLGELEL